MATFVLVQGAWLGGWYWKRVRRQLEDAGHDVFTPTLTGLADRSHLFSRDLNLDTHILDIVNLIQWEELTDVILCGHSYGGCVVTGVADRIPDRIRSLIYLDAFVLEDGENLLQHVAADSIRPLSDGFRIPPIPPEVFKVNPVDSEWLKRQYTLHPLGCFEQRIKLTGGIHRIKDVTYILAEGFREGSPFPRFYERAKTKGWKTLTMTCGHFPMLDQPEKLTKILIEAAGDERFGSSATAG
jgi:pimeloyl-ACP methyl ester carboxylesterase